MILRRGNSLRFSTRFFGICFFVSSCLMASFNASAKDPESDYLKAGEYYQKLDYENATHTYEELLKAGHVAPEIHYNLGNCYFKTGHVASALLNYERARKLAPDDEDIDFNMKIASLKVVDKMDAVPEIFYTRWLTSMASSLTTDAWAKLFIASTWVLFIFLSIYLVASSASLKKFALASALAFVTFTACIFILAEKNFTLNYVDQHAIVTSASVYVKSSPDEKGTDQFIIHEGTKVEVLDELGEWKKIRIINGSVGWLKVSEIEII